MNVLARSLTVTMLVVCAGITHAQQGPAGGRLDGPRVQPLSEAEARDAMQAMVGSVATVQDGPVLNIFRTLQHHPELMQAWSGFGSYILANSTLPPRHREMTMLRIGWLCQSDYEFGQHARIARSIGMTDAEILAITKGPQDPLWTPFERTLLRGVDELHADALLSDATWNELSVEYSVQQIIDYIFTVGQYNLVSMALNSLGVEREKGVEGFPPGS
jgi:alkylhydroperoxidase family enzyme